MFELLFKYSRATFERGELIFASGWPIWLLVILIVAAVALVAVGLVRRREGLPATKLLVLGALQTALLALILVLALRPALVSQTLRPQENSVAVLLDTSASMRYGEGERSRLQQAIETLSERALPDLESAFDVKLFSFAGETTLAATLVFSVATSSATSAMDATTG